MQVAEIQCGWSSVFQNSFSAAVTAVLHQWRQ